MANSKFDFSLLTPLDEEPQTNNKFDPKLLKPLDSDESEMDFNAPIQQGFTEKLPRNMLIGLAKLGHRTINIPYETAKEAQQLSTPFGKLQEKYLPALKGKVKQQGYLEQLVNNFNQEHDVPEEMKNPNWGFNVENIPHQQKHDYAGMLGQEGRGSFMDRLIQGGIEYAPDIAMIGSLLKHGISRFMPNVGEKISDIKNYKKLQEKLSELENKSNLAHQSSIESGLSEESALKQMEELKEPQDISKYLNKGANYVQRIESSLKHRLGNIESYWSNSYKNLKTKLKNSEFDMENIPEYESEITNFKNKLKTAEAGEAGEGEKISNELNQIMNKAPTAKDIKASDFLTKYQDFRDARYDLLQRAKDPKATAAERKELFDAYENSKPMADIVENTLNEGLGEHIPEFQRINKGYSEQIYPLRANKVAQKALSGKIGPNTLGDLASTSEGQELMREIVKQDPELMRNILGQRYSKKPSKIHELDENTSEFLYEMPELQRMIDENLNSINSKLAEINKYKEAKNISLKQKIDYENQAKELRDKIRIINRDKMKIKRRIKKVSKTLGLGVVGIAGIKSAQQLLK